MKVLAQGTLARSAGHPARSLQHLYEGLDRVMKTGRDASYLTGFLEDDRQQFF